MIPITLTFLPHLSHAHWRFHWLVSLELFNMMLIKLGQVVSGLLLLPLLASSLVLTIPTSIDNATHQRISLRDATILGVAKTVRRFNFATFHELEATARRPTTNADRLTDVRLIFKGNADLQRIIVPMETWGNWGTPFYATEEEWPLDDDAVLPYRLNLDIRDADAKMKRAGYTGSYHAVDVQAFSEHGDRPQPWWIFLMVGQRPTRVWVGDRDGQVVPEDDVAWRAIGGRNGSLSVAR